jgi:hypothetical protein
MSSMSAPDTATRTQTVQFSYEGVAYTVDLSEDDARQFDEAMATYLAVARRVGGAKVAQ